MWQVTWYLHFVVLTPQCTHTQFNLPSFLSHVTHVRLGSRLFCTAVDEELTRSFGGYKMCIVRNSVYDERVPREKAEIAEATFGRKCIAKGS